MAYPTEITNAGFRLKEQRKGGTERMTRQMKVCSHRPDKFHTGNLAVS